MFPPPPTLDPMNHLLVPSAKPVNEMNGSTGGQAPAVPFSPPSRPRSALSFNFCPGSGNGLSADEQRALTCVPQRPFEIKDFAKQVQRRKKNKAELKSEFICKDLIRDLASSKKHYSIYETASANWKFDYDRLEIAHFNRPCKNMVAKNASLPQTRAKLQVNVSKNSFPKVLPYDETRVLLQPLPYDPTSDYINASYIDSYDCPRVYIATQGPSKKTAPDFWRMVWQEHSGCIVMLTRVFDFIKVVCIEYWSTVNDEPYGDISVTVVAKETLADYIVRTIRLRKGHEEREIKHFQFLEWPMHRIPETGHILEFRRRILSHIEQHSNFDGPMIVHCCDGASRTGVFIALDVNLHLLKNSGQVDIYGYVKMLRQMRPYMVENKQQYRFLYEAVLESHLTGDTVIPVLDLASRMKMLSAKTPDKKANNFHLEFRLIEKLTKQLTTGVCAGGHRTDNRYKNRDVIMVPPDYARPYLKSCQGQEPSDYVNAVFVDGFQRKNDFIVAEWPQKNTVNDIWSLIYDLDCTTVVMLTDPTPSLDKPSFFYEKGKQKTYGIFTPEMLSWQKYPNIRTIMYKIRKKTPLEDSKLLTLLRKKDGTTVSLQEMMMGTINELKTTQFFVLECWPESNKVPTSTAAVIELFNMVDRWRTKTGTQPILIISPDGYSRAGVFCAAKIACEQITVHQEVDVFLAVKTAKINRPQLVNSPMEYKYCYDLVRTYVYSVATSTAVKTEAESTDH